MQERREGVKAGCRANPEQGVVPDGKIQGKNGRQGCEPNQQIMGVKESSEEVLTAIIFEEQPGPDSFNDRTAYQVTAAHGLNRLQHLQMGAKPTTKQNDKEDPPSLIS